MSLHNHRPSKSDFSRSYSSKMRTIVDCYKGKDNSLEKGNYRGLSLIDQLLELAERINEKPIRQQVDVDEMQFGFTTECRTKTTIFFLRQIQDKYLEK